jgi:hypothetical protein
MERWIKASLMAGKFEVFMMPTVQSLGGLDLALDCAETFDTASEV